jgi:hypothetical protein
VHRLHEVEAELAAADDATAASADDRIETRAGDASAASRRDA